MFSDSIMLLCLAVVLVYPMFHDYQYVMPWLHVK